METNDKTSPVTPEKDRNSVSLDLMHRMRLHGMAAAFSESLQATFAETMTPDSFLNWLLSREWDYRVARNIERLVKGANFRYNDASATPQWRMPSLTASSTPHTVSRSPAKASVNSKPSKADKPK